MEQINPIQNALERLNPEQRTAATTTLGPMLIIAGAGSGKTSVLTTRIALLLSQGVRPERILALTFTKKAAGEMKERIRTLVGDNAQRIMMGTFHSVFIRFLRPFADRLHFPANFTVMDEDDSTSCLKKCIAAVLNRNRPPKETWTDEMASTYKSEDAMYKAKLIASIISRNKNELITADDYAANPEARSFDTANRRPLVGDIFVEYRNTCHRMSVMDYDDILLYTDMLMANNPDVLAQIAGSYDYILVDEYQDTNFAQYSILRRLTWINKNICVVGDDSQSIYAFRGARIQNILNFHNDYKGCTTVKLERNYRSSRNIVNAANNLISNNEDRIEKVCYTEGEKGEPLTIRRCDDEKGEARYIASTIKALREKHGLRYDDFAVLYRTNAQSRAIEDALMRERIPSAIYSGTSFFSRAEVKDLMAYFKMAVNPNDDEAFLRIINKPTRGVGETAKKQLMELARSIELSLWETIFDLRMTYLNFNRKTMAGIEEFKNTITACIELAQTRSAYEAASIICDMSGFYTAAMEQAAAGDETERNRADNIRELVDSVKSYTEDIEDANNTLPEEGKENPTLAGYLQTAALLSNADTGGDTDDKVSLMTVHCAKGMEFDTVFVTGMEEGLFPLNIDGEKFEQEEERRLCYVAMTRAKRELILTRAEHRLRFGKRQECKPSQFLEELKGN